MISVNVDQISNTLNTVKEELDVVSARQQSFFMVRVATDPQGHETITEIKAFSGITGWCSYILNRFSAAWQWNQKIYLGDEGKLVVLLNASRELHALPTITNEVGTDPRLQGMKRTLNKLNHRIHNLWERVSSHIDHATYAQAVRCKPKKDESTEQWCTRIINEFQIRDDASHIVIPLINFPASKFKYYCELQKAIAKLIPSEALRPTIDLRLRGSQSLPDQPSFGILGGVGPLSDAEILEKVMHHLTPDQLKTIKIDLFSSPPPRTKAHKILRGLRYLMGVREFAKRPEIKRMCVASNTAHGNLETLQKICRGKMINLVDHVVSTVVDDRRSIPEPRVLVLGTKEAYDNRLYPKALMGKGLQSNIVNHVASVQLQEMIDGAKTGQPLRPIAVKLLGLIHSEIEKAKAGGHPLTHILLGCTELPMILSALTAEERATFQQVKIVDSEQIFADVIAREAIK